MECKVCGNKMSLAFVSKVLWKYEVHFYQCQSCFFMQTEEPYWLEEAYNDAVLQLDIGVLNRCIKNSEMIGFLIRNKISGNCLCLDYGGGYGIFTRLMRDNGYNFFHFDPFCKNIFAYGFEKSEKEVFDTHFDIITAFEVLEHIWNIQEVVLKIFTICDLFVFSTEILSKKYTNSSEWWYFAPEYGQHISFYSLKSLEIIANRNNLYFYTDNSSMHIFSKYKIKRISKVLKKNKVELPSHSLLNSDYSFLIKKDFSTKI